MSDDTAAPPLTGPAVPGLYTKSHADRMRMDCVACAADMLKIGTGISIPAADVVAYATILHKFVMGEQA